MPYVEWCVHCGVEQPAQSRGRPRTRCPGCGAAYMTGERPKSRVRCDAEGCAAPALVGGMCPRHAAFAHAACAPRCEARRCVEPRFDEHVCVNHARIRYQRYLPRRPYELIVAESRPGPLRRLRIRLELRRQHTLGEQLLAPPYGVQAANRRLAALLAIYWDGQCHICGGPLAVTTPRGDALALTIDHIRPRARKGVNLVGNLAPAHLICNMVKGDGALIRRPEVRVPTSKLRGGQGRPVSCTATDGNDGDDSHDGGAEGPPPRTALDSCALAATCMSVPPSTVATVKIRCGGQRTGAGDSP